jgi:hypothetical protein
LYSSCERIHDEIREEIMKSIFILFALFSIPALAADQVYMGEAIYTKAGWQARFGNLEQLGVERQAERNAYRNCVAAGARDCVIVNDATITRCNEAYDLYSTGCWAEAHSRGSVN